MAQKPKDELINVKQNNDLSMTGKPVLAQNQLGIFYGILEKADTRNGTVLLSKGYMLSPDRHITYARYLDFLDETVEEALYEAIRDEDEDDEDNEDIDPLENMRNKKENIEKMFADGKNIEIIIDNDTFNEHHIKASITDYASEGIALVNHRTAYYANTSHIQEVSRLVSLTNIMAIVPVSNDTYGERFKSMLNGRDDVAGKLFKHFELDKLYKLSALSTFSAISDTQDISPRLVVNTPQREERFKKRDDNIVVLEHSPRTEIWGTDDKGNRRNVTGQVVDSIFNGDDVKEKD